MSVCKSVLEAIGNTPLIEFPTKDPLSARILMKAEFMQPSGSLKDRMARAIVETAEKSGKLKPGGTIVEATAGNTGIAVAMVAAVKGYSSVFVMPDKFSVEKINMLKAYGSEVITTPANVPDEHPDSWKEVAKRVVEETPNAVLVNQFYNRVNVEAHYSSTGPELWEQTGGKIDAFISGAGSGGTISGVGRYLKEQAKESGKEVSIILMDPEGSIYFDDYYKTGKKSKKPWKLEGIGNDFIPGCLDFEVIDEVRRVSDKRAFFYARRLARECGLLVGDTSGGGVSVALEVARELGPGKTVVCLLCDSGNRYVSKIYNDEWMKANGFGTLGVELRDGLVSDLVDFKGGGVIDITAEASIGEAVKIMSDRGLSQLPIQGSKDQVPRMLHESDVLEALLTGEYGIKDQVREIAKPLQSTLFLHDDISLIEPLLEQENVAVVLSEDNAIHAIISRIDLVRYLSERSN